MGQAGARGDATATSHLRAQERVHRRITDRTTTWSAFVALLPDIDEGGSWVARRAKLVVSLACAPIGAIIGYSLSDKLHITGQPLIAAVVGALVALGFVGPLGRGRPPPLHP
ncbi:MAG TPA: hypothetical protein VFU22_08195 [Roseiflexaceae bacterium]|nr:hypothetical protein [Roseiflexaceae bacterium]